MKDWGGEPNLKLNKLPVLSHTNNEPLSSWFLKHLFSVGLQQRNHEKEKEGQEGEGKVEDMDKGVI